ncbi:MAG TPA: Rieske (2Fe-2S) protein [Polyangiaceae bacterium]|nr:Rieske (2Fe-2S) protein [Polyangiaceae bacterium]
MKQQRRVFLKVLAAGPLVGCAGAGVEGTSPDDSGGASAVSGGAPAHAGSTSASAGSVSSGGGSQAGASPNGGTFSQGGTFTNGGTFGQGGTFTNGGTPGSSGGGSALGGASTGTPNPGELVAHVSAVQLGSLSIVAGLFFMGRDERGIYAMSMQCTHKGCAVGFAGTVLECPCHKARFDRNGSVLQGPATAPLPHFKVYIDAAGNISVDRFDVVSADTRLAV